MPRKPRFYLPEEWCQVSHSNIQYEAGGRLISGNNGTNGRYLYNAAGQRVYKWAMMKSTATPDLNGDGKTGSENKIR